MSYLELKRLARRADRARGGEKEAVGGEADPRTPGAGPV